MDVGTMELITRTKIVEEGGRSTRAAVECKKAEIESFTKTGVKLSTGEVVDADVVIFATGFEMLAEHTRLVTNGAALIGRGGKRDMPRRGAECVSARGMWFVYGNLVLIKQCSMQAAEAIGKQLGVYGSSTAAKTAQTGWKVLMLLGGLVVNGAVVYRMVSQRKR
jgi:hypothetical protein